MAASPRHEVGEGSLPPECEALLACVAEVGTGEELEEIELAYGLAGSCGDACAGACFEVGREWHAEVPEEPACWPWDGSPEAGVVLGEVSAWVLESTEPCLGVEDSVAWLELEVPGPGRDFRLRGHHSAAEAGEGGEAERSEEAMGSGQRCSFDGLDFRCEPEVNAAEADLETRLHGQLWEDLGGIELEWEVEGTDWSEHCAWSGRRLGDS